MADPIVVMSATELRALVTAAVAEALADQGAAPESPALVDREGLACALTLSVRTIDDLRGRGLPTVWIASAPRFELAAVIAWLRAGGGRTKAADGNGGVDCRRAELGGK